MPQEYSKEELWKIYEGLPDDLKQAIFAEETANFINNICLKYQIGGNNISEVARYTGRVLMGILPIDEFEKTLINELKLDVETAKNVAYEINHFIFNPVKDSIASLYKKEEISIGEKPKSIQSESKVVFSEEKKETPSSAPLSRPTKPIRDIYREPIE